MIYSETARNLVKPYGLPVVEETFDFDGVSVYVTSFVALDRPLQSELTREELAFGVARGRELYGPEFGALEVIVDPNREMRFVYASRDELQTV